MGACAASLLSACDCCISDCCYGCLDDGMCGKVNGPDGDNIYNSPLGLVLYNSQRKQSNVYNMREEIFNEIAASTDGGRIQSNEDEKVDEDLTILDFGCGTGIFTEIICQTWLTNDRDKLLEMDVSPQCIQFIRNNVIESNKKLKNFHIEYFCNDPNSLCLEDSNYDNNKIDIIIMAFSMSYISNKKDRDQIMKQLYNACKSGGIIVVFEYDKNYKGNKPNKINDEEQVPLKGDDGLENDINRGYGKEEEIKEYVESFGFEYGETISDKFEDSLGDTQWIILFKKPISL